MAGKPENLTPFEPGQSGNPNGRPKGSRSLSTILREFLEEKVEVIQGDGQKVKKPFKEVIVRKLLQNASAGDAKAVQVVWDRTEGKAPQSIVLGGDPDAPLVGKHVVEFQDYSGQSKPKKKAKPKPKRKPK